MENLENLIEFNGQRVIAIHSDRNWWVAVKSVCDALHINYAKELVKLYADETLSPYIKIQYVKLSDNTLKKLHCIQEKYIYGWLFKVWEYSPLIIEYKLTCYNTLYDFFHTPNYGKTRAENRLQDTRNWLIFHGKNEPAKGVGQG